MLDRYQQGKNWIARVGRIFLVRVREISRAHEAVRAHLRLTWKVVKHQHPLAKPVGANLEAGAVGGKGVVADGPRDGVADGQPVAGLG